VSVELASVSGAVTEHALPAPAGAFSSGACCQLFVECGEGSAGGATQLPTGFSGLRVWHNGAGYADAWMPAAVTVQHVQTGVRRALGALVQRRGRAAAGTQGPGQPRLCCRRVIAPQLLSCPPWPPAAAAGLWWHFTNSHWVYGGGRARARSMQPAGCGDAAQPPPGVLWLPQPAAEAAGAPPEQAGACGQPGKQAGGGRPQQQQQQQGPHEQAEGAAGPAIGVRLGDPGAGPGPGPGPEDLQALPLSPSNPFARRAAPAPAGLGEGNPFATQAQDPGPPGQAPGSQELQATAAAASVAATAAAQGQPSASTAATGAARASPRQLDAPPGSSFPAGGVAATSSPGEAEAGGWGGSGCCGGEGAGWSAGDVLAPPEGLHPICTGQGRQLPQQEQGQQSLDPGLMEGLQPEVVRAESPEEKRARKANVRRRGSVVPEGVLGAGSADGASSDGGRWRPALLPPGTL